MGRRVLGNYYYTGFCANHVSGEGPGTSLAAWKASNGRTILGFNVMTPRAQDNKATRQRHFLCLETFAGKVFLKWCTQCHTWKNLELYMPEEGPTEVRSPPPRRAPPPPAPLLSQLPPSAEEGGPSCG